MRIDVPVYSHDPEYAKILAFAELRLGIIQERVRLQKPDTYYNYFTGKSSSMEDLEHDLEVTKAMVAELKALIK